MIFSLIRELPVKPDLTLCYRLALVIIAYSLTGWLGLQVPFAADKVTLFWLPSGIAVAALYRWSMSMWVGVFFGALIINTFIGSVSALANLIIASGNTLGPVVTVLLLRYRNYELTKLASSNALRLPLIASLGMLIPAFVGTATLILFNAVPMAAGHTVFVAWWMGDSLGVLLAAPILIYITHANLRKLSHQKIDVLAVFSVSLIVGLACFPFNNFTGNHPIPIVFVSFVCVAWAALSLGLLGTALTTLGFTFMAVWSTVHHLGPFSFSNISTSYWLIWIYTASMAVLGQMITAAHAEIISKSTKLTDANRKQLAQQKHLDAVFQAIPDLLFEIDRFGNCSTAHGTATTEAISAAILVGKNIADVLPDDASRTWTDAISEANSWGQSQGKTFELHVGEQTHWFELSIAKNAGQEYQDDRFICLVRDITKRVHAHQADLANEQRFRNIFEATRHIAVQGYNRFHEVIFWNKASEDLYGYSAAETLGKKLEDLIIPDYMREGVFNAIEDWHSKNIAIPSGELALKHADGREVWVYSNHVMIETQGRREMYCLDIDLEPQRQALQRVEDELHEKTVIANALRKSEARLKTAQLMARIADWTYDPAKDLYNLSYSAIELFQIPTALLQGTLQQFIEKLVHPDDRAQLNDLVAAIRGTQQPVSVEFRLIAGEQIFWVQSQGHRIIETQLMQGTLQDISERKRFDIAVTTAAGDSAIEADFFVLLLQSLTNAVGANHAIISMIDPNNNATASTHTYIKNGSIQPNFSYELKDTPCADVLDNGQCFVTDNAQSHYPNDKMFTVNNIQSYIGSAIKNAQGETIGILVLLGEKPLNVSAQIRSLVLIFAERIAGELRRANDQEKIFNLAFFDPLTGLPNRRMLLDRLKLITAQSARSGQHGALLFIDIDHFKILNDTRGHHIGDQLLAQVAERISSIIRASDLAARLGGDEFVVVFDNLGTDAEIAALEAKKRAEQLHELINLPYPLQQSVHHCTISIGVNLFNKTTGSIDDLLRHADVAMYQAKDSGRNAIRFFDPNMQSHLDKRAITESDLRTASDSHNQLVPYYQVQVNNKGKAIGAELLLRWFHPHKGMISPADFIPVAEQTGLIVPIGKFVIKNACERLKKWSTQPEFAHLTLAVNVSPIQFNQPNFVEDVVKLVQYYQIDPSRLKLELTEGSLLKHVDQSIEKMQQLQAVGIGFSMDDFGIGYSSLSYLKRLPLDQLKIDQTFVRDIAIDPNDAIIVRTIIAMAHSMDLHVIAEGVEMEVQKNFLEQNGCLMFQGYYFGRPVAVEEFELQLIERQYCP